METTYDAQQAIRNLEHVLEKRGLTMRPIQPRLGWRTWKTSEGDGYAETFVMIVPRDRTVEVQARAYGWTATFSLNAPEFVIETAINSALEI